MVPGTLAVMNVMSLLLVLAVGLVLYGHHNLQGDGPRVAAGAFGRITGRLRTLFKEFF